MQPKTTSDSSSRYQPSINEPPTQDDTMLMGFEFFDEKGRLNPRNILFSAQTSPSRANSILTTLFGKVMQLSACRWAERFLEHTQKKYTESTGKPSKNIENLLTDIRKSGSVNMTRLFVVSMPIKKQIEDFEKNLISQKTEKKSAFYSAPSIINTDEVIRYYSFVSPEIKYEIANSFRSHPNAQFEGIGSLGNTKVKIDKRHALSSEPVKKQAENNALANALVNFANEFHETSKGRLSLPKPISDIMKSGFFDYCQSGASSFAFIDVDALEDFLVSYSEKEKWQVFKNVLTDTQLSQLEHNRKQIADDISEFRRTNPRQANVSRESRKEPIDFLASEKIEAELNAKPNGGLFFNQAEISFEDLNEVDWKSTDLYHQISLHDAYKIRDYFSSANLNEENLKLSKQIRLQSKELQQHDNFETSNTEKESLDDEKNRGTIISAACGSYLQRFTKNSDGNKKLAENKKSSKTRKSKVKQPGKVRKTNDRRKTKVADFASSTADDIQSARKQLKDANDLIARINGNMKKPVQVKKNYL